MSMYLMMQGYAEAYRRQALTPAQRAAEDKAAADKAKAERNVVTDSWQDLYNTGGDKALAEHIRANYKNGGAGWKAQDITDANAVFAGSTFAKQGQLAYDKARENWNIQTRYGDKTRYGAYGQTLQDMNPWAPYLEKQNLNNYDSYKGWVDPQIQIDKDNAAKAEAEKAAEAKRRAEAAAAKRAEQQAQAKNTLDQKNQSVANAFGGGNNKINQNNSVNTNREEAVDRVQEYQNTTNSTNNTNATNTTNTPSISNTTKTSSTKSTTSLGNGYVQQLADDRYSNYKDKWKGNSSNTINYSNIFQNDIKQNIGNAGDWKTSFGNNNKLNNVRAGNNYTLNLGNINTSEYNFRG